MSLNSLQKRRIRIPLAGGDRLGPGGPEPTSAPECGEHKSALERRFAFEIPRRLAFGGTDTRLQRLSDFSSGPYSYSLIQWSAADVAVTQTAFENGLHQATRAAGVAGGSLHAGGSGSGVAALSLSC